MAMMASEGMSALSDLLTCKKRLIRVSCNRVNLVKGASGCALSEYESVYVASASIENASLKAVQFLNQAHGVNDYEVESVCVMAGNGSDSVFID